MKYIISIFIILPIQALSQRNVELVVVKKHNIENLACIQGKLSELDIRNNYLITDSLVDIMQVELLLEPIFNKLEKKYISVNEKDYLVQVVYLEERDGSDNLYFIHVVNKQIISENVNSENYLRCIFDTYPIDQFSGYFRKSDSILTLLDSMP